MKSGLRILFICILSSSISVTGYAQSQEVQQLLLDIEKLTQFKKILQDMYNGYKILQDGYNRVKEVASGNFRLHQVFLDGLYAINPEIKKYSRIPEIISNQVAIVKEYKSAFSLFKNCGQFTPNELDYLSKVYTDLTNESLKNLDALIMVITGGKLRMSDDERIEAIDQIADDMQNKLDFIQHFDTNTHILALQRLKDQQDINGLKALYDLK